MALVDLTKQLAKEALLEATKPAAPAAPPAPEPLASVLVGQIRAMQKALKEDEELAVWAIAGAEKIRVLEIYLPSFDVLVLSGVDANRAAARLVAAAASVQLLCKTAKVPPDAKPARVVLVMPKGKDSSS